MHKSCFYSARDLKGNCFPQAETRRFAARMDALARKVVEIAERDAPPDKEISTEYMFFCPVGCGCVHCSGSPAQKDATREERAARY